MTIALARPAQDRGRAPGWLLIGGIVLASLTEAIGGTALSLSAGDIMGDIHATPDEFAWLDIGYTAAKLTGFALTPWLLARVRPCWALLAATLATGAAGGLAAFTAPLDLFILLRAIQGSAGAVLLVSGQAILFLVYPRPSQPLVQAIFAMGAVVAPATLAPALQGWLIDSGSWTWVFFAAFPVSLAAAGLLTTAGPVLIPPTPLRRLDWMGLAPISGALFCLTYLLSRGNRWEWFEESRIVWLGLAAGAGIVLFALRQAQAARNPLFDLGVFRSGDFSFAFTVSFVAGAALLGSGYLIPGFAVSVLDLTPTDAGFLLIPSGAMFAGSLLLAAYLIQARGLSPIATVPFGIALIMAAMWMLSGSSAESGAGDMMPAVLLRGLGLGFLFLSITLIAFDRLPRDHLAVGIALFSIGRQLGGMLGLAGLQTLLDHEMAVSRTVLGTPLVAGEPAVAERLASMTALLMARGLEPGPAGQAATALLGRTVSGQAAVIAFDTAFAAVALLFVAAAPIVIGIRIALSRAAARRVREIEAAGS